MFKPLRNPLKIFVVIFSQPFISRCGKYETCEKGVITIIYDLFDLASDDFLKTILKFGDLPLLPPFPLHKW